MLAISILSLCLCVHTVGDAAGFANQLKSTLPFLSGSYPHTWGITGRQVKAVLGEPSHMYTHDSVSASTWHFCHCDYEQLGLRVVFYAENRLGQILSRQVFRCTRPVDDFPCLGDDTVLYPPIPDDWELSDVRTLKSLKGR